MIIGSTIFNIEAVVGGVILPADLLHLERALYEGGYSVSPSLKDLQDGRQTFAKIFWITKPSIDEERANPSKSSLGHSFVCGQDGSYRLVVDPFAEKLEEFARQYEPVPLHKPALA